MSLINHTNRELGLYMVENNTQSSSYIAQVTGFLAARMVEAKQEIETLDLSIVVQLLSKLVNEELLTALSGQDWEWERMTDGENPVWQNIRYPWVFKNNTSAWDTNAEWLVGPDGIPYRDGKHIHDITFPYTPTTRTVLVDEDGHPIDNPDCIA